MTQYRCETCKNCSKNPNDDYFCLVTNDEIDFTDFNHTARVGCASHSDPQTQRALWCGDCGFKESETCNDETTWKRCRLMSSEPEGTNVENRLELARNSARDKLLDILDNYADSLPPYSGKDMPKVMLKKKIAELRQVNHEPV